MTTYLPAQDAFHNPLDDFTDREIVLQLFDQYLDTPSDNPYILAIKGISGIGKTFLISYLIKRICPLLEKRWYVSRLAFSPASEPDFQVILASIGSLLQECVPADKFQEYLTKCEGYIHHFDEYRVSNTVHVDVKADNQSLIFGISPKVHIDAQLQDRRIHLRNEMGNALIELSKARLYPLCLFIDGYERLQDAAPELTAWFFGDILHRMCQVSSQPLRVVTCGWKWPDGTIVEPFYA